MSAPRLLALGLIALAGCGPDDGIRSYRVPASTEPKAAANPAAAAGYRILGGMFPADDPVWFVKLTGPAEVIREQEAAFDQFLGSFRAPAGPADKPGWELPAGWRTGTARPGFGGATVFVLRAGPGPSAPEVTVQTSRGGVAGNVVRWGGQLGTAIDPTAAEKFTRPVDAAGGLKGLRVDMSGPTNPAGSGPKMMGK